MPGQGATNTQTSATYAVKKGDTLSTIAAQFLGDRNRWREIAAANPGIAPDALKPGQVVVLPAGCRAAAK
jgi:nucleoid-associated protein YgaU